MCSILSNGLDQYLVFYNSMVAEHIEVLDYFIYRVGVNGISRKIRGYNIV